MQIKRMLPVLAAGLPLLLLAGCNAQSAVGKAAQERWDALIGGNLKEAYPFYTAAYQQATPFDVFKHKVRGVGLWSSARVQDVKCGSDNKQCQVEVDVSVTMKMHGLLKPVVTHDVVKENWVREGWFSDWRYLENQASL